MCNERCYNSDDYNYNNENCPSDKCIPFERFIKVDSLAKAYVPFQKFCSLYDLQTGLIKGTVFPELASPYCKSNYMDMRMKMRNDCKENKPKNKECGCRDKECDYKRRKCGCKDKEYDCMDNEYSCKHKEGNCNE